MKPPDDLKAWSKNELVREVRRLRAIMREHAERRGDDPRAQATTGAAVTSVDGDPHAARARVLDTRAAVLMDTVDVVLVDTKSEEPVRMMLALGGRINYADRPRGARLPVRPGRRGRPGQPARRPRGARGRRRRARRALRHRVPSPARREDA
jgi:hypothetical protein